MENSINIYKLDDLIKMYMEGTLPEGEKIFKYEAFAGLHKWIHVDELKIQANFNVYYPQQKFIEGFRGIVNTQHANKPLDDNTNNS